MCICVCVCGVFSPLSPRHGWTGRVRSHERTIHEDRGGLPARLLRHRQRKVSSGPLVVTFLRPRLASPASSPSTDSSLPSSSSRLTYFGCESREAHAVTCCGVRFRKALSRLTFTFAFCSSSGSHRRLNRVAAVQSEGV